MNIQTLIATVNLNNIDELLRKMNINTDCIIANQCDIFSNEERSFKGKKVKIYNFDERGVGLNRNNALMRANSDIVLIADDDVEYVDDYDKIIIEEFQNNPKADMILFNLQSTDIKRTVYQISKNKRIHKYDCLKYGAIRIAVKLEVLLEKNIYFSLLFGGGAKYSAGEDSLFILECIRKGMKIYASPKNIGFVDFNTSSWFNGYNEKFFRDKRKFFDVAYGKLAPIMCIQLLVRHKKMFCTELKFFEILKIMLCSGGK